MGPELWTPRLGLRPGWCCRGRCASLASSVSAGSVEGGFPRAADAGASGLLGSLRGEGGVDAECLG